MEETTSGHSRQGWSFPTTKGTPPLARGGHSCCHLDNKLYIFGGSRYNHSKEKELHVQDDFHCLDLTTLQWSRIRSKNTSPSPRYAHTATAVGKKIVLFGGFNGKAYLDDIHVFDTVSGMWLEVGVQGNGPAARYAHSATLLGSHILIFGGCGASNVFNDIRLMELGRVVTWLDPQTSHGTPPPSRAYHTLTLITKSVTNPNTNVTTKESKLYLFGGRAGTKYFNDLHVLALDTMTWTKVQQYGAVPSPRAYHMTATVEGSGALILFGGMDGSRCFNEIHVLDTNTMTWRVENFSSPPPARHKHDGSMVGNALWIFGGMDAPPTSYSDVLVLTLPPNFNQNHSTTHSTSHSNEIKQLQHEIVKLKEENEKCFLRIEYLSGKHLERFSLGEIEDLEKMYLEGLQRLAAIKKEKIIQACRQELQGEKKKDLSTSNNTHLNNNNNIQNNEFISKLQETVTQLQSENLKLRRKMKDAGLDLMEGVQKVNNVVFTNVNTRQFLPQQGVPSGGIAPLGMDMIPIKEDSEPLSAYEKRREAERRGVLRIPEEERISILRAQGISQESLIEEGKHLEQLNWYRLQSISSPTENPLPQEQRDMYRRTLNN